ncbi:MAG: HAD hydrolase family protein [Halofilum sp. (in: g-proteobacteria)]|nr:HAD hydrolase family protein [Halofilum sp. (in: g-proteobacteria)]
MDDVLAGIDESVRARAATLELVVFDVDGVLTDGRVVFGDDGFELKAFSTRDGLGMRLLQDSGVAVGIITGRTSTVVSRRAEELRVRHLMQGRPDKGPAMQELLERTGIAAENAAYVGDDVVDLPAMRGVALGIAVADADAFTRRHADHVTRAAGGAGAAREVCELVMAARGTLESSLRRYLD